MSLIEVRLQGELGKKFGRTWNISARDPNHALRIINANTGGNLMSWIRSKASRFTHYKIICEYKDGRKEAVSEDSYGLQWGDVKRVRFTPVIVGAGGKVGGIIQTVVGVVLVVAGLMTGNYPMALQGAAMLFGGISQLLAPKVKKEDNRRTSHYFNGTEQTQEQGAPVQLIYGRCKVSGFPISVATTVDQRIVAVEPSALDILDEVIN